MTVFQLCHLRPAVDPETLAEALAAGGTPELGRPTTGRTRAADSFDARLAAKGLSLLEDTGRGGARLTLMDGDGDIVAEAAGGLDTGFADALPAGDLGRRVGDLIGPRRLLPGPAEAVRRADLAVRDGEGKIVLRARLATSETASEVRLLPVRGYGKWARAAGRALKDLGCVRGPAASPAEQPASPTVVLDRTMPIGAAAKRIHIALLDRMAATAPGAAARIDPEFLHEFRVAVRRTRSLISLVSAAVLPAEVVGPARTGFRDLGHATNRMRDLDVYLLAYPEFRAGLPPEYRDALDPFRAHLAAEASVAGRKVASLLRGDVFHGLAASFRANLATAPDTGPPAGAFADAAIAESYTSFVAKGRKIRPSSPPEKLHALRVRAKKLRYLLEFFAPLSPKERTGPVVKELKRVQDVLGRFQDATVQAAQIRGFAAEMAAAGRAGVETQMAMGMVAEAMLDRQHAARAAFAARFARLAAPAMAARLTAPVREAAACAS